MIPRTGSLNQPVRFKAVLYFQFLCVRLCGLGVSAVINLFKYLHRRDAENAEVTQRNGNLGQPRSYVRDLR